MTPLSATSMGCGGSWELQRNIRRETNSQEESLNKVIETTHG